MKNKINLWVILKILLDKLNPKINFLKNKITKLKKLLNLLKSIKFKYNVKSSEINIVN
jgi:hypothetical protein